MGGSITITQLDKITFNAVIEDEINFKEKVDNVIKSLVQDKNNINIVFLLEIEETVLKTIIIEEMSQFNIPVNTSCLVTILHRETTTYFNVVKFNSPQMGNGLNISKTIPQL